MKPAPDGMTVGHRIMLTILIVVVILMALAAFGYFTGGWDNAEGKIFDEELRLYPRYEDDLINLDRAAIQQAYSDHIKLVFGVWMKDPNDPAAPKRAGNGARNARAGYVKAMDALDEREHRLIESRSK